MVGQAPGLVSGASPEGSSLNVSHVLQFFILSSMAAFNDGQM